MKKKLIKLLQVVIVFSMVFCGNLSMGNIYADTVDDYSLTVNDVTCGDTAVSGTGVPTTEIEVTYPDTSISTTIVGADGKWSANVPSNLILNEGEDITVTQLPNSANFVAQVYILDMQTAEELENVTAGETIVICNRLINTTPYSVAKNVKGTYEIYPGKTYDVDAPSLNGPTATEKSEEYDPGYVNVRTPTSDMTAEEFLDTFEGGSRKNPLFTLGSYNPASTEKVTVVIKARTYKVTYHANGGSGSVVDSREYLVNEKAEILSGAALKRKKYKFKEWNTEKNGSGISFKAGDKVPMEQDMTLYAQWTYDPPKSRVSTDPPSAGNPDKTTQAESTKTGDENNFGIWLMLMGMSILGAGYLIKRKNA